MKKIWFFLAVLMGSSVCADDGRTSTAVATSTFPTEQERAAQRQAFDQRGQQIEEQYKLDTKDCYQRFDVVSCKIEARERRIAAKAALREEERPFKAMERQIKTEEAKQRLAEKQSEAELKHRDAQRAEALAASKERADANAQKQIDHALKGTKRGDYEQKQREAVQHRIDAENRIRERGKDAAAPLPVPRQ